MRFIQLVAYFAREMDGVFKVSFQHPPMYTYAAVQNRIGHG